MVINKIMLVDFTDGDQGDIRSLILSPTPASKGGHYVQRQSEVVQRIRISRPINVWIMLWLRTKL